MKKVEFTITLETHEGLDEKKLKHILERPSLFNIGDIDYTGWVGEDFNNATIQQGSEESIYLEVVQPSIDTNVTSDFNYEIEYYYSSSLSASLGLYYSSSFVITDLIIDKSVLN